MSALVGRTALTLLACGATLAMVAACADEEEKPPPYQGPASSGVSSSGTSSSGSSGAGGAGGTMGSGGSADMVTYCDTVIPPFCEALFACCADQAELDAYGGTVSQCATQLNADCLAKGANAGIETLLDSGDTVLNSGELSDCAANLQTVSVDCSQPPKYALNRCWGAFEGQMPPGSSCGIADDDLSWLECQDGHCLSGTCIAFLGYGEGCVTGANPPAYCNLGDGERCVTDGILLPTCGEPLANGNSCVLDTNPHAYQCWSLNCDNGLCAPPTAALLCQDAK